MKEKVTYLKDYDKEDQDNLGEHLFTDNPVELIRGIAYDIADKDKRGLLKNADVKANSGVANSGYYEM